MFAEMLPLLVFTTFAGLAAGAYAVDALCGNGRAGSGAAAPARPWLFPLVCLVLLGLGLCGTLLHLGQPLRFVNGMANPGSMIAQEAYWSIAFGAVIVVDLAVAKAKGAAVRPIRWAGGLVAVGLMVVTGPGVLPEFGPAGLERRCDCASVPGGRPRAGRGSGARCSTGRRWRAASWLRRTWPPGVAFAAVLGAFGCIWRASAWTRRGCWLPPASWGRWPQAPWLRRPARESSPRRRAAWPCAPLRSWASCSPATPSSPRA